MTNEINNITENLNDVSKEIDNKLTNNSSLADEIKGSLNDFKEILDQLKEIQEKLKGMGISPDVLSQLAVDSSEADEVEEATE